VYPGAVDPSATAGPAPKPRSRALGWGLAGLGVAGVGTAVVSGFMLVHTKSTVDANCRPDKVCNAQGLDAVANGKTLLIVNTTGWIVGALGLGSGAFLLLSGSKSGASAAIAPAVGPASASLSCVGTF
jgi:hypothetical protein